jgi:hypothetical protein
LFIAAVAAAAAQPMSSVRALLSGCRPVGGPWRQTLPVADAVSAPPPRSVERADLLCVSVVAGRGWRCPLLKCGPGALSKSAGGRGVGGLKKLNSDLPLVRRSEPRVWNASRDSQSDATIGAGVVCSELDGEWFADSIVAKIR